MEKFFVYANFNINFVMLIINKDKAEVKKTDCFYSFFPVHNSFYSFFPVHTSKQTEARDRKRKFWEVKPSQPYKKRRIENGALRLV